MASSALVCPRLPQIVVGEKRRAWYHFVTTLCAIVGGVFVVAGMLDGLVHGSHALLRRKLDLGAAPAPRPSASHLPTRSAQPCPTAGPHAPTRCCHGLQVSRRQRPHRPAMIDVSAGGHCPLCTCRCPGTLCSASAYL